MSELLCSLWSPSHHEPLRAVPWSVETAIAAIGNIVDDYLEAFDERCLWPIHEVDRAVGSLISKDSGTSGNLYYGAAGIIAGLAALERFSGSFDLARLAASTSKWSGPPGSYMFGSAGAALAAYVFANDANAGEVLYAEARAALRAPVWEIVAGLTGFVLAARHALAATGEERWAAFLEQSRAAIINALATDDDGTCFWPQGIPGASAPRALGAAHGFAGIAGVLLMELDSSGNIPADVVKRIATAVVRTSIVKDEKANWPKIPGDTDLRLQWCHGAPGFIKLLSRIPVGVHAEFDALLCMAGEAIWEAGPRWMSPSLCHGTAGNGYALLSLYKRDGRNLWLERARSFAMHAIDQLAEQRARFGTRWYSLWTGDIGLALFLASCVDLDERMPTIDCFYRLNGAVS